jgi:hypothetical protein
MVFILFISLSSLLYATTQIHLFGFFLPPIWGRCVVCMRVRLCGFIHCSASSFFLHGRHGGPAASRQAGRLARGIIIHSSHHSSMMLFKSWSFFFFSGGYIAAAAACIPR